MTAVEGPRVWERRRPIRDAAAVLRTSLVVLRRHWPVLCALSFAGQGARSFINDGAVRMSHINALAGLMTFILVPIATLCALTLMVWTVRTSLPSVAKTVEMGRRGPLLDIVGSVMIPFLAVYASYGYLQADDSQYAYDTLMSTNFFAPHPTGASGTPTTISVSLVVVVVIAVGLRAMLGRWSWAKAHGWVGIIRAYLEITWLFILARLISPLQDAVTSWLDDRRVVHGGSQVVDQVKGLGAPAHGFMDLLGSAFDSIDTVLLVPLAWLAVGAVIYGATIGNEETPVMQAVVRRFIRWPRLIRRAMMAARGGVDERLGPLISGLRVLQKSGLASMLMFCLLFLVTQTSSIWLFMLERTLIGPRDLAHFWMPISLPISTLNDALQMVFLVCLLGAAVDRVLRHGPASDAAGPAEMPAQVPGPADGMLEAATARALQPADEHDPGTAVQAPGPPFEQTPRPAADQTFQPAAAGQMLLPEQPAAGDPMLEPVTVRHTLQTPGGLGSDGSAFTLDPVADQTPPAPATPWPLRPTTDHEQRVPARRTDEPQAIQDSAPITETRAADETAEIPAVLDPAANH